MDMEAGAYLVNYLSADATRADVTCYGCGRRSTMAFSIFRCSFCHYQECGDCHGHRPHETREWSLAPYWRQLPFNPV